MSQLQGQLTDLMVAEEVPAVTIRRTPAPAPQRSCHGVGVKRSRERANRPAGATADVRPSVQAWATAARLAVDAFLKEEVDRVVLVYNEFKSVMTQRVVVEQLLPITRADVEGPGGATSQIDYLYEPSPQEIFNQLLPRYIEVQVYRALLESNAAFFAAQMTAMDTATKNSAEMIGSLTLYMNKVRQAAITREIIEVVSGADAL